MEEALNVGIRVELARRGWNQRRLARELGMTQATLSRRLTGNRGWTARDIAALSQVLGIPADELLRRLPTVEERIESAS